MAKNVTVTPADGDIQFENSSGTAAGRIEQSGDDLVISNAVGDILFGDTDADVYIGDGVNSVDVLFEVSGAIKADPDSQGVTLTLGGAETDLQLYAPSMSNLSAQGSESTTLMINTNGEIGTRELGSAAFSNTSAFATSSHSHSIHALTARRTGVNIDTVGNDNFWEVTIGTQTDLGTKPTSYVHVVSFGDESAGLQLASPYSSSTKLYYRQGTDNGASENGANTYKNWREIWTTGQFSSTDVSNWNTAYGWGNHASAGYLTSETYTGTVTSVTVGTGLDVSNGTTTPSITLDLSELTDMTANVNTSQDELILLDNGAERRKLFSEVFGSAAYSNTSAFISASNADTASELITFSKGISSDGNSKFYNWRALDNSSNSGNFYWHIGTITGSQSTRFMVTLAGRSTSYSDNMLPAMGHIVGQLNNDNNYDIVFYNHSTASSEVVTEVGIVDDGTDSVHLYVKTGNYAELTATAHISDGRVTTNSNSSADGTSTAPDGYATITEYTSYNSGNLTAGQNVSISSGVIASSHPAIGQTAGTYGSTANGTKIDSITIDENGHVTNIATGATGNMTGFFVEDGDGTEVQITNAKEWKFVEGTGIDIDWTDTSTGNDSDPYDLTFAVKDNSIGIDQLNVSDGTNGQVLTTNGSGTLSFSTVTSGSSYGWTLGGTDIESGDEIALGGGLSLSGTGGTYTLTSANDNTTYTAGTGLTLSGTEFSVTANTYAAASHNHDGRYYTESESDQRFPRGRTVTYSDAEDSGGSDAWYKIFQVTDSGSSPVECHIRCYAHTSLSFVVSEGYQGGHAHINILDALSSSTNNNYKFIEGVRVASNGDVEVLLNGGANVSIEMTLIGDATPVGGLEVSTAEAESIKDSVTVLSNGMMRTYGKLYIGDTDTNTTSTTALVLNGEEVESRTLGSNAFTSYSDHSTQGYLTAHPAVTEATENLSNSGRTYIQSITLDSNGHVTGVSTGTETVTNSDTQYSAGSGLDLTGTTFSIESDLRDGVTRIGKDSNNFIAIAVDTGVIDFTVGGTWVARMESDGDLHIKGDVIAFSSIFNA